MHVLVDMYVCIYSACTLPLRAGGNGLFFVIVVVVDISVLYCRGIGCQW